MDKATIDRTQYKKCCEIILDKMEDIIDNKTVKKMFHESVKIFADELETALFGKESEV